MISARSIERTESGIVAFINPHAYIDAPVFRGMRWRLLKAFDKIYCLNLHGNARLKETTPDGHPDDNVFDIQQGVCINIFVKTGRMNDDCQAEVYYAFTHYMNMIFALGETIRLMEEIDGAIDL